MEPNLLNLLLGLLLGLLFGLGGGLIALNLLSRAGLRSARAQAQEVLAVANLQAETIRKEADLLAKEDSLRRREALDREIEDGRRVIRDQERRLEKRDELLDQKLELINKKEREFDSVQRFLAEQQEELNRRLNETKQLLSEQRDALYRVAGLTPEVAKSELFAKLDLELRHEAGGVILRHEQALKESCVQKSREILATAIQRYAAGHTAETTVSTVDIPSDDMKGRIIGREGRNIRAFEKATWDPLESTCRHASLSIL